MAQLYLNMDVLWVRNVVQTAFQCKGTILGQDSQVLVRVIPSLRPSNYPIVSEQSQSMIKFEREQHITSKIIAKTINHSQRPTRFPSNGMYLTRLPSGFKIQ